MSPKFLLLLGGSLATAAAGQDGPPAIPAVAEIDVAGALPEAAPEHRLEGTVFTAAELENRYLTDPIEIARWVPNMVAVAQPALGSGNLYSVRGLSGADAVGTYIDGVRLPSELANHFGMFDVERVEIVRGPAPLVHAEPAPAGGIHVRLHRPGTEWHGVFEGFYGAFDRLAIRGSLDLPASDVFALNVSGYYQNSEGYVRNLTTGERVNDADRSGARLGFRLSPHPRIDWFVGAAVLHDESLNLLNLECGERCEDRFATTALTSQPDSLLDPFGGLGIAGDKDRQGLGNEADTKLVTSEFTYRGNRHRLTLTTGIVGLDQDYAVDLADGRPIATLADALPAERGFRFGGDTRVAEVDIDSFSQDVRLAGTIGGLDYTVGGALARDERRRDAARVVTGADGIAMLAHDRRIDTERKTDSLYASLGYETERFGVEGGVRYSHERVRIALDDLQADCTPDCLALGPGAPAERSYDIWQAYAEARAGLAPGVGGFVRAARGYRAADWTVAAGDDAVTAFAPETSWTYEAGVDAAFWDDRLRLGLTGFYLSAEDAQVALPFPTAGERIGTGAGLDNLGVEATLAWVPLAGLSVHGALGWQDASYEESLAAPRAADGSLAEPVYAPDLTAAARASYDWYIAPSESYLTPSIGFTYRGAIETRLGNLSVMSDEAAFGGSRADGRFLVHAGLALRTDEDWWLVSVECDNCLDETHVDSSVGLTSYLARPMTWTFRARRKF